MMDLTLPLSSLDAPASPRNGNPRKISYWLIAAGLCAILAILAIPGGLLLSQHRLETRQTAAVNQLRGIGLSLFQFETEYGKLPDSTTASEVTRSTDARLALSDQSSNDVFAQLIAAGIARKSDFTMPAKSSVVPADESDATVLAHGETVYAYVAGDSLIKGGNPGRPILLGSVIPGTTRFDPAAFDGQAVVLTVGTSSISNFSIRPDGKLVDADGADVLDPQHPIWGGKPFTVKWPK
jgi:hypothetical protein